MSFVSLSFFLFVAVSFYYLMFQDPAALSNVSYVLLLEFLQHLFSICSENVLFDVLLFLYPYIPYVHCTVMFSFKPIIFHCNVKPLAVGHPVGVDPQRDNFALGIPTCWYLKSLADPTQPPTRVNNAQRKLVLFPVASRWVPNAFSGGIWALALQPTYHIA